ncbi:uncharacterized protein LOC129226762 [Uloborus diversus]|uniref:uncharacterized protein LOC129226762 n=1 Tax=Uloborus diversus TaxID=327109 RepID=UPI00240935D8|nr:uncharacterized protein LOC129226762 [Uloborus diversus]
MYLKHACLYKRRQQLKKVKRRITLNRFDAILRCNSLIIKMARLRFPGRPRHRIGKNYVKFAYDDVKMNMDACMQAHNKIEVGLKLFYELFGYSDEEEEFDGFGPEDLAQADAIVALKLKQKRALHRYLESNQELSSSGASEIERILSSDSDSSSSSSSRQKKGMRDVIRKPCDKLIKGKLEEPHIHNNITNHEQSKQCIKSKCNVKKALETFNSQPEPRLTGKELPNLPAPKTENHSKIDSDLQGKSKASKKKTLLRHLLEKTKHEVKVRRRRKRSMRPNVKKKFRKNLMYSSRNKYSPNLRKTVAADLNPSSQIRLRQKSWSTKIADAKSVITSDQTSNATSLPKPEITKVVHSSKSKRSLTVGRKRFVLPSMSARSSRKIIPRRRYMDEYDQPRQRALDEESQGSRSSLSGSSEAISAMDGGSSPDDSRFSEDGRILNSKKKVGILDRPLIVEGKRPWKPSLKVQMKLSEMKLDYPFALKKNIDGSSGTSSGSFKDIIKPDMVSKYAEKMAQKPKEKPLKLVENVKKNFPLNAKSEPDGGDCDNSDALEDSKKPEDKLEKVAAKIEKLLKSQWEGRLKDSTVKPSTNVPPKFESDVVHWKNEQQQQLSCNQKRTKSLLRKARLQLKRRNLNLRTRQSDKQANLNVAAEIKDVNSQVFPKNSQSILPSLSVSEQMDVPSKNVPRASVGNDCASAPGCSVCGFAKICSQSQKLYDQITCDPCNNFFEGFAKSPKQYFCIKKGNCNIDSSKENVSKRVINARCKACWLKACMEKLTVSTLLRDQLIKYIPRLDAPPHNPLLTDNVAFFQEPITFMDLARSAEEDKTVGKNTGDSKIDQINFVSSVPKPFDTFSNAADDKSNSCITGEQHSFSSTDCSGKDLPIKKETSSELSKSASFDNISTNYMTDFNQRAIDETDKLIDSRKLSSATDSSSLVTPINGTNVTEKNAASSIGVNEAVEDVTVQEEAKQKGPRIKHVCRRAAVVLGLPRATFSDVGDTKEPFFLSALPEEEKQKILETVPQDEKPKAIECSTEAKPAVSVNKTPKQQGKKKLHKDVKVKNRVHLDLLKKSSLLIQKEQKRRKLLMKKSMKHLHKHSFKKSLKLSRRSELKKTLKFSYKSAVKTSVKSEPKVVPKRPAKVIKCRKVRCKQCEGCLAEDCGQCAYCLFRRCLRPVAPASERRSTKTPQTENIDKSKPFGGHSSFGGDGPSGIGTSLTSSSSSPSSPDGSSCGSSCSSSSTTSSSGSSGSSSSSSSGSSSSTSSTSSSDNVTVPDGDVMGDSCAAVPFMHSIDSESVILQESECIDNNVVTNPLFPDSVYDENDFSSDLDEALLEEFAISHAEDIGSVENESVYRENDDTILYEETSSIIELKNASFAPSLMYSASLDESQSNVSTSTYTGSKNQNSKQSGSGYKKSFYNKDQDQYGSAGSGGQDSNEEDDDDEEDDFQKKHFIYADYWFKVGVNEAVEDVTVQEEAKQKGPRIKHVCRRAAVVLGLPRATFSDVGDTKEPFFLSALPEEEKQKILETVPQDEKPKAIECSTEAKPAVSVNKTPKQQGKKKLHKDVKVKNRVHLDLLKKSSLLIQKEQKRRKLLMKKSMKHLHKHSFKKSLKLSRRSELKKTLKFSYKSAVKTSVKSEPKVVPKRPAKVIKCRKVRCKQCEGCLAEDCGQCAYCLDKKKFGGPNLIKQACMFRRCLRPVAPASERRSTKTPQTENIDKSKPFGGHSSFGGDGPSGIGTSLTSSSSSPSSPDGSSCGSSCSSSSTTSSSGSSGSSSSSSSGSSSSTSSTSSSDNVTVPDGDVMGDSCAAVPFMHSIDSESVILQESECIDNNVVTNPLFPDSVYDENDFSSDLDEALLEEFAISHAEDIGSVENESVYRENDDTILYEETSSIIELKNASFAPSLMYSASLDESQSNVSTSTYTGSKNQNSKQSGSGYKKSFYNKDQDQYGSAGSGGQDSNEEDDDDEEDDFQKKHFIYADYWENYDFDKISCQGFALISSQQIPLQCVCYLCGSAGEEKLIFCVLCCEPYHTFCLSEDDVPHEENIENWCCKRCQCCAVCGLKNNLLKCRKCQNAYHAECLAPQYPTKPSRKKRIWMCPKCVKCKSCGTTSPASGAGLLWNFDLLLCQSCAKLTDKGNYCPVCHKCYEENDYDSEMVQCFKCSRWVHAKCDNMSDEDYQVLSCLPETVVYTCIECTVEPVPLWRNAIKEYLKTKLRNVFNSLMASKSIQRIIRHDSDYRKLSYVPNSSEIHKNKKLNKSCEKFSIFSAIEKDPKDSRSSSTSASSLTPLENLCEPTESGKSEIVATISDLIGKVEANSCSLTDQKHIVDFMPVKYKLERGRYKNIELKKTFPWFKLPVGKLWRRKVDFPDGMLPNAVVPPSIDHTYSQYLERTDLLSSLELSSAISLYDSRSCVLCGYTGDSTSKKCGRLLYCGQDDWIHVNCAVWSAEVLEQEDGSLRNVHPAIARGKLMSCEFCNQMGATVGCCVRGCPANYHFYCARKDEAMLQADRKVFCALHKDNVDAKIIRESDFPMLRRINVSQASIAPKWVKKLWQSPMDKDKIQVLIGSLKITKLGHLTALSNGHEVLIPVNYECTRIFWSTKNPRKRVKYMCRIVEMLPDNYQWEPHSTTHKTIVHSENSCKEARKVDSELDSNQDVQLVQISEKQNYSLIENIVLNDVKFVLNRLIKAVVKQFKKSRKQVNYVHSHDFKYIKNGNDENNCDKLKTSNTLWLNGFSPCCKSDKTKNRHSSSHDNQLESLLAASEIENNIRNCKNQVLNSNKSSQLNANSILLNSEKNELNCEIKKYIKENDFKKFNKLLQSYVLNGQNLQDSEKLMHLIAEKEITKEIMERFIHQNKGLKAFPDNMLPLLKSVLPPCSVRETVLPVFNVDPKENRMNESSGYSSNDDSHLKHSSNIRSCTANNNDGKLDSAAEMPVLEKCMLTTKENESLWKKLKFNGKNDFGLRCNQQNVVLNCDNTTKADNIGLNSMLEDSNIKIANGISLSGPFKCHKCKRLYRTEDSYKKHSEVCNFFLDSSSADEDSTSSESSEETFESLKKNFILSHNDANAIASACNLEPKNDNANVMKHPNRTVPSQNSLKVSADLLKEPNGVAAENSSSKKSQSSSFSAPLKCNAAANQTENRNKIIVNQNKVNHNSTNHQSKHQTFTATSQNRHILPQNHMQNHTWDSKSNLPQRLENNVLIVEEQGMPSHFQIPEQPGPQFEHTVQDTFVHSVPMNVNNLSIAAENISSYNIGYSNTVCNNSGLMQVPCNTLVIPPQSDGMHQPSSLISQIQVPQNNFLTAPVELTQNSQLSYVGSITITNNETMSLAVNVPDQIVPIFPSNNVNFGPTTLIPSPLQMQQATGIHLSTVNVQQISLQGSFASNSLNPFIYPQQTVAIPQNQVMILEEPMSHPTPQPNYIFQVPVGQTQNCTFPSILPQQQLSQQFTNQIPFNSISQNQVNGISIGNNSSNIKTEHFESSSAIPVQPDARLSSYSNHLEPKPYLTQNETNCESNIVSRVQSLESRLSPTDSAASSTVSSEMMTNYNDPSVSSTNNNIVSILKKAAEQMLNLSAEMSKRKAQSKEKSSEENTAEKKTRFAHTRKVAARTAEKLKKKRAVLNGNVKESSQPKTKSLHLNIAALKPAFTIPIVPVTSLNKDIVFNSTQPPVLEGQNAKVLAATSCHPTPYAKTSNDLEKALSDSDLYSFDDDNESILLKIHMRDMELKTNNASKTKPYIMYEIQSEDGFNVQSDSLKDAWKKVYEELQDARIAAHMKNISIDPEDIDGFHMLGLDSPALTYLLEQLPGAEKCADYNFTFHKPGKDFFELPENASGCARSEIYTTRREYDMFSFLASEHRDRPIFLPPEEEEEGAQKSTRRSTILDLPIAMRFKNLKSLARETVGVYRSSIHGRGLFCKRNIDPGELVIEYAGEVVRSVLTDKRERIYQSKGIGCYMFRIDDDEVVDATMHGNAARFINHSCEPNCFSKVITVDGKKHIVIFALRRIIKGEELTYDYKFPFEEEKIPCHCNSRRCRKYLN